MALQKGKTQLQPHYPIASLDLLTFMFESEHIYAQEDTKVHISAENPSLYLTLAQLRTLVRQTAFTLRHRYGIGASGPGKDIAVVYSTGQYTLPVAFYGVIAAGGVYSAASPSSTVFELERQVREGEPKILICSEDLKQTAMEVSKRCNIPSTSVLVLGSDPGPSLTPEGYGRSCISSEQLDWERITDADELRNSLVCLLYSSGTTGVPKGVCMSHLNLVASAMISASLVREYTAQGGAQFESRTLAHLPCSHVAGILGYLINPQVGGGETYWMRSFDWIKFLEYNKKYQITWFFSVPPIYLLIAKSPLVKDQFQNLIAAISGAAPMGKELQIEAGKKLGKSGLWISQTWGASETTGSVTSMPIDWQDSTGSVSPLNPNAEMKVVDDDGKEIPGTQEHPGELVVKGPIVAKKYFKNPKATEEAFTTDGWYRTGDVGYVKDGFVYIVDRKKELIKYKGHQVAPAELEALLLSHPLIADAAVIGVKGHGTELPRAYIVADQSKISETEIQDYIKEHLARHKQLRGGVRFLQAIPKSPSGKILRQQLRAMAEKEITERKAKL